MINGALGLIETVGFAAAAAALDAAADTADVKLVAYEKVIGAGKCVSVTINLVGEVAAVQAAVDAGKTAAERIGKVLSAKVIPKPHKDVEKLISQFSKNIKKRANQEKNKSEESASE